MIDTAIPLALDSVVKLLTSPDALLSFLLDGLAKSGVYVMIASGLTLIFGLMDVINFAHGSFTMMGAYFGGALVLVLVADGMGAGVILGMFLLVLILSFVLFSVIGALTEVTLIQQLYDYGPIFQILLTFGVSISLEEFMRMIVDLRLPGEAAYAQPWTAPLDQTRPAVFGSGGVDLGVVSLNGMHLLQVVLGAITVAAIWAFLNKTRYGLFVRAGVQDSEMAEALGIDVGQTFTVVFAIGSGLAGLAGALLIWDPLYTLRVALAFDVLLPAFVIVIVGGLGSFKGTVYASLIVGYVDATQTWMFNTGVLELAWVDSLLIFMILVIMLIIKPQGLFGIEVEHG